MAWISATESPFVRLGNLRHADAVAIPRMPAEIIANLCREASPTLETTPNVAVADMWRLTG